MSTTIRAGDQRSSICILDTRTGRLPTRAELHSFLNLPHRIYADDPLWVPPLVSDHRRALLRPADHGFDPAAAFLVTRNAGASRGPDRVVARAAAGVSRTDGRGTFGFFESEDDPDAVATLLCALRAWAREVGVRDLTGPYQFDFEDAYGVLIDGFDVIPALLCGHAPAYYRRLLEDAGLQKARPDALAFRIDLTEPAPDEARLHRLVDRIRRSGEFRVRTLQIARWEDEVDELLSLVNDAQASFDGYVPWTRADFAGLMKTLRRIADPDLILIAERAGRIVGWFPGIPSITPNLQRLHGLRRPWHYLRLAGLRRGVDTAAAKSVHVRPEHWGSGVALLLFDEMFSRTREKGYHYIDLSLTGEDNPHTQPLARRLGGELYKRYRIYRIATEDPQSSARQDRS